MYLHLGANTTVISSEVIGIFDLDNTTVSSVSRQYLADAQKNGKIQNVTDDLPRSFVLCSGKKKDSKDTIYITQLSPSALIGRAGKNNGGISFG
jgi:hypothetical protein